jgi:hypothetical protein
MDSGYAHSRLRHVSIQVCLVLSLLLSVYAGPARADETEPVQAEPDAEQYDMYYDAMLRSIELDKNRWKSFSRSMESGPWFYDTHSLKRAGKVVTVMVTVFPHPDKTSLYSTVYAEHTKIRKIVFVTEINCSKSSYRQPRISVYGYYNELLAEHSSDGTGQGFSAVKPGTTTDTLRSLICGPDRKMGIVPKRTHLFIEESGHGPGHHHQAGQDRNRIPYSTGIPHLAFPLPRHHHSAADRLHAGTGLHPAGHTR